jgi:hypothetical protein
MRMVSGIQGTSLTFLLRSWRYDQNDIPNFLHVFFRLVKVSRQRRPSSLRVEPLILRFLTYSRIACSLRLLCKGMSGRFNTSNNSDLWFIREMTRWIRKSSPRRRGSRKYLLLCTFLDSHFRGNDKCWNVYSFPLNTKFRKSGNQIFAWGSHSNWEPQAKKLDWSRQIPSRHFPDEPQFWINIRI